MAPGIFCLILFLALPVNALFAQKPVAISDRGGYVSAVQHYQHAIGENSPIYYGKEFIEYPAKIEGSAFFGEDWREGSIFCDSLLYNNVLLRFDLVGGAVLVDHSEIRAPIQLDRDRVSWFSLFNHRFVKMENNGIWNFYDLLLDEKVKVLVKRKKIQRESIDEHDRRVKNWFEDQSEFYLVKGDVFYRIRSKKSLVNVLENHKKEVRKFMSKRALSMTRAPEISLVQTVQFYNQLP